MLSLEIEKFQIMSKNQGGKRKLIIFLPGVHRRDRGTGSMKMARAGEGFPDERTPIEATMPLSATSADSELRQLSLARGLGLGLNFLLIY
jgi:hypothetical protein